MLLSDLSRGGRQVLAKANLGPKFFLQFLQNIADLQKETKHTPAQWAAAVHRILLAKPAKAWLTEDVAARFHLERLVEQIEADRADHILRQGVQFWFRLKKFSQSSVPLLLHTLLLPPTNSL